MMNKKTGFVDLEKLEMESDVMSSAGGRMYTDTCSWGCPTCVIDFIPQHPTRCCGTCVPKIVKIDKNKPADE